MTNFMDYFQTKLMMEMYGLNPELSMVMSIFPRYPPGKSPPTIGLMSQKRLKEKFQNDNASIYTKFQDFNQMYQKFASGLFEQAYPVLPPGHPVFSRSDSTAALNCENDLLRKENIDLKKQLEKKSKSKTQFNV